MSLPMITKDDRCTVVCSADPAVVLKFLPQTEEERKNGTPAKREARRPFRWLDVETEVDLVLAHATKVTYRPIDCDEQFQATGGISALTNEAQLARAQARAVSLAVVAIETTNKDGARLSANTPEQVQQLLPLALKLAYREVLGARILDETLGYADPLPSSE